MTFRKAQFIIPALVIAVGLIIFSIIQLYENSKTDGYGSGFIVVSSCSDKNYDWHIYSCMGAYTSNSGMQDVRDASVEVTGAKPHKGDMVDDVYAPAFVPRDSARTFITQTERSSVLHNLPWLVMLFAGLLIPIIIIAHGRKNRTTAV